MDRNTNPLHRHHFELAGALRAGILLALLACPLSCRPPMPERTGEPAGTLPQEVVIRRTAYGVPHVLGENLRAMAFGLAWVMTEDYRERVPEQILKSNGRWGLAVGRRGLNDDFPGRMAHELAGQTFPLLPEDVREILAGFAAGVNHYIALHSEEFPEWARPEFSAEDIAARDLVVWSDGRVRAFQASREGASDGQERSHLSRESGTGVTDPDIGSNAWAFAPERTQSGYAVLVRNPHLSFTSGYYEAHITVPGVVNFYGDFRLGGPFTIIGGFNDRLGWSTTNNYPDVDEVYALLKDPDRPDHYLFDGRSVPLEVRRVTAEYRGWGAIRTRTREFRFSSLGPVLHETADTIFVVKSHAFGQYRLGEQWLRMMQASNLEEWKEAMRIQAKFTSNFTYADADGNIFYVWNAAIPTLPYEPSDDVAVFAAGSTDVWSSLYPWDDLPQLLNPAGGYIQNSNDPFHFTNLNEPLDPRDFPANFPEPQLGLRSQHSLQLVHNDRVFTLEDIVDLKHSMRMMLADRVKDDLLAAVRQGEPNREMIRAAELLADWDNRAARESRGAVLFKIWANRYFSRTDEDRWYQRPWTPADPTGTPRGLGDRDAAVKAFRWAVDETEDRFGSWDVAWGEVHRVRAGDIDLPVGGCASRMGCFRVLSFREDRDRRYRATGGDAWILAVEFAPTPRAYSVLVYGNSDQEDSPYFYNQAEMFADNRMKVVAFTEEDIDTNLTERYRPGERGVVAGQAMVSKSDRE
jgi:acyl-homoserine-lactone acylase